MTKPLPRVEVKPIETAATPDPGNVNKHTQRGRGLLENELRKRGAFRSIASAGKGVETPVVYAGNLTLETAADAGLSLFVLFYMAWFTKRQTIGKFISQIRIFSPFFYMMSMKIHPAFSTFLACIVISPEHIFAPLFVFISGGSNLPLFFIAFVGWMLLSFFEMRRILPVFRRGSFFYPTQKSFSKVGLGLKFFLPRTNFVISFIGLIRTFFRAITTIVRWGCSKFFSAHQTFFYNRRNIAILRTIYSLSFSGDFFSNKEFFATSKTNAFYSWSFLPFIGGIGALVRAILPHSISNAVFGKYKNYPTILTSSFNHLNHISCSKKETPAGLRRYCSGSTRLAFGGQENYKRKNALRVTLPEHLYFSTNGLLMQAG